MDQICVFMHESLQDPERDAQNDRIVCYAHISFNFPALVKCTELINVWSKYRAITLGPHQEKFLLQILPTGNSQTSLLSYRD